MKNIIITCLLSMITTAALAQIDTLSFPKERREVQAILHDPTDKANDAAACGDMVAVGPKGDISFSVQDTKGVRSKEKLIFKAVKPVSGK
jgi:hypothetical protein